MSSRHRLGLVISAVAVLLGYKLVTIARLAPWPVAIGWQLEALLLLSWWALAQGIPQPVASRVFFYAGFYVLTLVSLAHTFFFGSAAERRISLLEVDLRTLGFFFSKVLPPRGYLVLFGLPVLMHALAHWLAPRLPEFPRRTRALVLTAGWTVLALQLSAVPRPPSPFADMGAELFQQLTMPVIEVDRSAPPRYAAHALDKSAQPPAQLSPQFEKVLVFVMETMTSAVMTAQSEQLPQQTFVRKERAHAHRFTRYFATNQDSRTGMLSMLGSRFIPYEAYTEDGRDHYLKLGEKSSLLDLFKRQHYRSAFAVSQQEIELVVGDLPWDETIHLEPEEIERARGEFLCFVPYEFEHSCEDRALLPEVFAFIDRKEPVFLYQEFIWGHAAEYNEASGRTNTDYYSAYLDAVIAHLEQTGAIDRTLIVLTSDHGFRDKGLQSDRAQYQLPLWFHNRSFAASEDAHLFTHLDFKDLLMHEAFAAPAPSESPFALMVGPTGTSFLSVLTQPGQFVLIKARDDQRHLLHAEGFADRAQARRAAGDFLRLFDEYLTYFGRL